MSDRPRIVCDFTNAPDTPEERLDAYARLFTMGLIASERTAARMLWRLRYSPEAEALGRELAALENACCAFLTTTVTVVGDELHWNATTIDDPMAAAVLDLLHDLPETIGDGVDALHERFNQDIGVPLVYEGAVVAPETLAAARESPYARTG
jgi:hypothetical protein